MADYPRRLLLTPTLSSEPSTYGRSKKHRSRFKIPGFALPLLGIQIACIAASIVVLRGSHKSRVHEWRIPLSVWLSIITAIYAISLGGLFSIGVAVLWWRGLAHGTTVEQLHFVHAGASLRDLVPAWLAGNHARRVAVAALIVFAAKMGAGPMLQRSTGQELHAVMRDVQMNIEVAPEIPDDWFEAQRLSAGIGKSISQASFLGADITTMDSIDHMCPPEATCKGKVQAAGLNLWNTSQSKTLNLMDPASLNKTLFSVDFSVVHNDGLSVLFLDTRYVSAVDNNCVATITHETHAMIPGIMEYDITIHGNIIYPDIKSRVDDSIIIANASSVASNGAANFSESIMEAFAPAYLSKVILSQLDEGKFARYGHAFDNMSNPVWGDLYLNTAVRKGSEFSENVVKYCPLIWNSPSKDIMHKLLEFLFRASRDVAASRDDPQDQQHFTAGSYDTELRYNTNPEWLLASVILMAIGTAAASSLLWGWWQLDRYVTLSPLETGRAFDATIFTRDAMENEATSILRANGNEKVAHNGEELIWSGSLYVHGPGTGRTLRGKSSQESEMSARAAQDAYELHKHDHLQVREYKSRRGPRSLNDADPLRVTRSFQHDRNRTTQAHTTLATTPTPATEEIDIAEYSQPYTYPDTTSDDRIPLIQLLSNIAAPRNETETWRSATPQRAQRVRTSSVPSPTVVQIRSLGGRRGRVSRGRGGLERVREVDRGFEGRP